MSSHVTERIFALGVAAATLLILRYAFDVENYWAIGAGIVAYLVVRAIFGYFTSTKTAAK